jgi:hypothetical protein
MNIQVNPAVNPVRLTLTYEFDVTASSKNIAVTGMVEYEPNDERCNDSKIVFRRNMSCGYVGEVSKEIEEACMNALSEFSPTSIINKPEFGEVDTAWEDDMPA